MLPLSFLSVSAGEVVEVSMIPRDLRVELSGGGLHPWDKNLSVRVSADGRGRCSIFIPGNVGEPPLQKAEFSVDGHDLERLWTVIEARRFFELEEEYIAGDVEGGTFLALEVQARGKRHRVTVENLTVEEVDAILETLRSLVPESCDLKGLVREAD